MERLMNPNDESVSRRSDYEGASFGLSRMGRAEGVGLKVRDLMTSDVYTLGTDNTLEHLQELMRGKLVRHVPIVNDEGKLIGLVTHRDFLKVAVSKLAGLTAREEADLYAHIRIGDIMGKKVTVAHPETLLEDAANAMLGRKFGCLPVVDENDVLIGILTSTDFVKVFSN